MGGYDIVFLAGSAQCHHDHDHDHGIGWASSRTAMATPFVETRHLSPVRGLPAIPTAARLTHQPNHSRDFWIPQVTEDGQVSYHNVN